MTGSTGRYELWGTFSVRDHLRPGAFVAEVLLYDHLVIPVPPKGDSAEWDRWTKENWDPERQQQTLAVLGPAAVPVPWTGLWQSEWGEEYRAVRLGMAQKVRAELPYPIKEMPFIITGQVLQRVTPSMADGVVAVYYETIDELEEDLDIRPADARPRYSGGLLSTVLGRRFLIPDPGGADLEALKRAVDVAQDPKYRERRRALYEWQKQFLSEAGTIDQQSLERAVGVMNGLVDDLENATREQRSWTHLKRAFLFAQVGAGVAAAMVTPVVALVNAAIALGQYLTTTKLADANKPGGDLPSAALLVDARRDLGLERLPTR